MKFVEHVTRFFIVNMPIEEGCICFKEPEEGDAPTPISPYVFRFMKISINNTINNSLVTQPRQREKECRVHETV